MIEKPDLHAYVLMPAMERFDHLADVCESICSLLNEVAVARAQELTDWVDGYQHSGENSKTGKETDAKIASGTARLTVLDREADLAIKTEEKWFLLRLIDGDTS